MKKLMILAAVSLACACNGADGGNLFDLSGVDLTGDKRDFTVAPDLVPPTKIIHVTDSGFSPQYSTIKVGTTVIWVWDNTATEHTVVSGGLEEYSILPVVAKIYIGIPDGKFCSYSKQPSFKDCATDQLKDLVPGKTDGQKTGQISYTFQHPGVQEFFCAQHSIKLAVLGSAKPVTGAISIEP